MTYYSADKSKIYLTCFPHMKDLFKAHINDTSSISDEKFEYVYSFFKTKTPKKHQLLIEEGEPANYEYWVAKGCLKAYHTLEDGKTRVIRFAMEDWWISDYQAYLNQSIATLSIECIENCEVLMLSYQDRERLCKELPEMEHFFRKKIEGGYVSFQRRLMSMLTDDASKRFELFQLYYPSLLQRIPKTLIASYLGISRETLSRISKKL